MAHKKHNSCTTLRFPSGRLLHVTASRRELAKKLCALDGYEWYRFPEPIGDDADAWTRLRSIQAAVNEQRAAKTLERYGMIERYATDPNCIRWSQLHERPTFGGERDAHEIYGHRIANLSIAQKELLTLTLMATARRMKHEVLTLNNPQLRRSVEALARRGIVAVTKRESVWALSLGEKYQQPAIR